MNERWPFVGEKKNTTVAGKRFKLRDRTETWNIFNKRNLYVDGFGQRSAGATMDFQYNLRRADELPFPETGERHCGISAIGVSCIYL